MPVRFLPLSITSSFFTLVAISPLAAAQNPGTGRSVVASLRLDI